MNNGEMKSFPIELKLCVFTCQLILIVNEGTTPDHIRVSELLLKLFNFFSNDRKVFNYFKNSSSLSSTYKNILKDMVIPCFFNSLNIENVESSNTATSILHVILTSSIGCNTFFDFLQKISESSMLSIDSD
ncbi:hypothetical protein MXB_2536, partial [Myxobolus squamalis]